MSHDQAPVDVEITSYTVHCFTYAMKFGNFLKMLMAIIWSNDQATSHDTVVHVVGYGST